MPHFEVIVEFTRSRSLRKVIVADDCQEADDRATAELNAPGELVGWEDWGAARERPEIVSVEPVMPPQGRGR
jgi:hypothetical protein